jgi:SAM-dependent methyltransferase
VHAVHAGPIETAPFPPRSFDLVALFDVVEHFDDPGASLRRIRELLDVDGRLILVTPDAGSWSARLLRSRWPHLLAEHLVCFSRPALRALLEESGFAVERMVFAWKRVNLQMVVRHAQLHEHVAGRALLTALPRLLPAALLQAPIPFNLGEVYVLARRRG